MPLLLVLLFIVVPIAELAVLIQVGQAIGVWWTIALLIADSRARLVADALAGPRGLAALQRGARGGPRRRTREVIDGVLVIFGGALLLTPGFITDIFGLLFLLPPTRALLRRLLVRRGALRMSARCARHARARRDGRRPPDDVEGTAVDIDPDRRPPVSAPSREAPRRAARAGRHGRGHVLVRRTRPPGSTGSRAARALAAPTARRGSALARAVRRPRAASARSPRRHRVDATPLGALELPGSRRRTPLAALDACASTPRRARLRRSSSRRSAPPAELGGRRPVARPAGWRATSSSAACSGTVARRAARGRLRSASAGTRGAIPDWDGSRWRARVGAWFDDGTGVALAAVRPARAPRTTPTRPSGARCSAPSGALRVDDPRLSTTYDGDGRQRRAGLELWRRARTTTTRAAAPARSSCGSTLELGALRLDCAFFRWHIEGRDGRRPLRRPAPRVTDAVVSRLRRRADLAAARRLRSASRRAGGEDRGLGRRDGARPRQHGEHPLFALERGEIIRARVPRPARQGALPRAARSRRRPVAHGRAADGHPAPERGAVRLLPLAARRARPAPRHPHQQRARVAPLWRTKLPIDEDLRADAVDSAFVGMRKPEPEFYALALSRLGAEARSGRTPSSSIVPVRLDPLDRAGVRAA